MTVPIGTILPYGGAVDGKNKGILKRQGWLICDGTPYSGTSYPNLQEVIGSKFGGDTNNNFNVPDLRGRFVRGVDGEANRDPDHGTRKPSALGGNPGNKVGSVQEDESSKHTHKITITGDRSPFKYVEGEGEAIYRSAPDLRKEHDKLVFRGKRTGDTEPNQGLETRPKNIYVNWIIKAKDI